MNYQKELCISKENAEEYKRLLTVEPTSEDDCFGEDLKISNTVKFEDETEMDIELCGVQFNGLNESNLPYTQAVLFRGGVELSYTEPSDEYEGEWYCEDGDGNTYTVIVVAS